MVVEEGVEDSWVFESVFKVDGGAVLNSSFTLVFSGNVDDIIAFSVVENEVVSVKANAVDDSVEVSLLVMSFSAIVMGTRGSVVKLVTEIVDNSTSEFVVSSDCVVAFASVTFSEVANGVVDSSGVEVELLTVAVVVSWPGDEEVASSSILVVVSALEDDSTEVVATVVDETLISFSVVAEGDEVKPLPLSSNPISWSVVVLSAFSFTAVVDKVDKGALSEVDSPEPVVDGFVLNVLGPTVDSVVVSCVNATVDSFGASVVEDN